MDAKKLFRKHIRDKDNAEHQYRQGDESDHQLAYGLSEGTKPKAFSIQTEDPTQDCSYSAEPEQLCNVA